jgi:hypothetical protein
MFIVLCEVYACLGICIIDRSSFHFLARMHSKGEDIVYLCCPQNTGSVWVGGWQDIMSYTENYGFDPSHMFLHAFHPMGNPLPLLKLQQMETKNGVTFSCRPLCQPYCSHHCVV